MGWGKFTSLQHIFFTYSHFAKHPNKYCRYVKRSTAFSVGSISILESADFHQKNRKGSKMLALLIWYLESDDSCLKCHCVNCHNFKLFYAYKKELSCRPSICMSQYRSLPLCSEMQSIFTSIKQSIFDCDLYPAAALRSLLSYVRMLFMCLLHYKNYFADLRVLLHFH